MNYTKSKQLLSVGTDAKTVKGEKIGILTGILYLSPANSSGHQTCPKASKGCTLGCLNLSGRGVFSNVQNARINKTRWFFQERETFLELLVKDVARVERKAIRENKTVAIRLNGTSDIAWEKFKVTKDGIEYANIFMAYPQIQFYDYSKILNRKTALKLPNYHLTFSLAEDNDLDSIKALKQGYNLAVVLNVKPKDEKPKTWSGYPVVNGDDTDVRFFDPKGGHIVALTAKGKARQDTSGFVRTVNSRLLLNQLELKIA